MKRRITAVLGDYYHSRETAVQSLEQARKQLGKAANIEIEYITADQLIDHLPTHPDAVILGVENRINPEADQVERWMTNTDAKKINTYVEDGGVWIGWHAGIASYESIPNYTTMLRGHFLHHPVKHQVVTYESAGESSIVQGIPSFAFLDEHYFVTCDRENTNVFLQSRSVDGESEAGWYHQFGKGKVMCLTPAHLEEGLQNPDFIQLFSNVIRYGLQL
ncbi:ThuA domain-containing protein [Gracilibacillus alcaliphilus]|uniref:ThuA domain-containing protein n=1 Tax=Gracilibacillus alcaliphilus TaxID=1401441 RepID=UPI00195EF064|nr:ThuA domain-containing protein [Gracilibacillus alcaliphilus]MBM7679685.1 type 1 glutamine amidotransferase [Gracilibacillus alcaliphilus]